MPLHNQGSSRFLRVDTQATPPRTAAPRRSASPNKQSSGFMQSTAASHGQNVNQYPDENANSAGLALEKMKANLARFTKSGNRRMLLRTLKDFTLLRNIPVYEQYSNMILPNNEKEWLAFEQEVAGSLPIEMNGMLFGANMHTDRENIREGKKFLQLTRLLCNKLAQELKLTPGKDYFMSSDELYQAIMMRLAPGNSSATTYNHLQPILDIDNKELIVDVPEYKKVALMKPAPTRLTLYVVDGVVHATFEQAHAFGLFRKSDALPRPWVSLTATIHERINLSTQKSVRRVSVQVHDEKLFAF